MTSNQIINNLLKKNPEVARLLELESDTKEILTLIYKVEQTTQKNLPTPYIIFCELLEETKQKLEIAQNQPIKLS